MEELENVVNDTQESNGDSQTEINETELNSTLPESEETVSENNSEVAEPKPAQSKEENDKYATARREAEKEKKALLDRQTNFARSLGYSSFEEMEEYASQQKYVQEGYDEQTAKKLANVDKLLAETEQQKNKARIAEEKAKLSGAKFFKDLEVDIDSILENNPNLSVEFVYKHVRGEKMDELFEKEGKAVAQRTLNNINGKSHIKPDSGGIDEIDDTQVDEEEFRIYKALNRNATKQEYAKFKKQRS